MVGISVERRVRRRYVSRDSYFGALTETADRRDFLSFCRLMGGRTGWMQFGGHTANEWRGVPWVTPVIGTGCLAMPEDPYFDPDRFRAGFRETIAELFADDEKRRSERLGPESDDELTFAEIDNAIAFAEELLRDRIQLAGDARSAAHLSADDGTNEALRIAPFAARVTVFATILTAFFFRVRAAKPLRPLTRWDQDQAECSLRPRGSLEPLDRELWELCVLAEFHGMAALEELEEIDQTAGIELPDDVRDAIKRLLKDSLGDICGEPGLMKTTHRVSIGRLRLVTEVSWFLLTGLLPVYPGWSDLLFELMLRDEGSGDHVRPQFLNLRKATKIFPAILEQPSRRSWDSLDQPSQRNSFYRSVAEVLWQQDAAIGRTTGATLLPPASAFITSFDLELEFALWNSAPDDKDFFVVIPVHVFETGKSNVAKPCWLRGRISKRSHQAGSASGDGWHRITHPTDWMVLNAQTSAEELLAGPHVVRLTGSPLIKLPDSRGPESTRELEALAQDMMAKGISADPRCMDLQHAVTIDEYLAVQQAEAELLFSTMDQADIATRSHNRALPQLLRSGTNNPDGQPACPRFWMAFGIPISDPAVRQRLVSQLARKRLTEFAGPAVGTHPSSTAESEPIQRSRLFSRPASDSPADPGQWDEDIPASRDHGSDTQVPDTEADRRPDGTTALVSRDPAASLTGVAVNRRVWDDEASLLYWIGFDVVEARASDFTEDLLHYAAHLAAGPDEWDPPASAPCTVGQK